jgi:hypothetical protein
MISGAYFSHSEDLVPLLGQLHDLRCSETHALRDVPSPISNSRRVVWSLDDSIFIVLFLPQDLIRLGLHMVLTCHFLPIQIIYIDKSVTKYSIPAM